MPYADLPKEKAEALEALERLVLRHKLLSEDEGRRIARVVAEDPSLKFPAPRPVKAVVPAEGEPVGTESAAAADEAKDDGATESAPSPS